MIRVLLVDDEELVCRYLRSILEHADDITVVAAESDGAAAVDAAVRLQPDVILMDLRMPVVDGLMAIKRIRQLGLAVRVVALTTFDGDAMVRRAMQAGADGFLVKSTAPGDLSNLVRVAAQGQVVLSPGAAESLFAAQTDDDSAARSRALFARLTARERQVLSLLSTGDSNADIGRSLQLTETTIKGHVSRILDKLECQNRTQAGLLAQRLNGIVRPRPRTEPEHRG